MNRFPVCQFRERLVHLQNFSALRVERRAAREDADDDYFHLRLPFAHLLHDGLHAFEDVGFAVVVFV